jgi:hypothetical protein
VSREYDECRAEQALLSLEDKVELDQAIAILIELLQAGNAGSYGYDLYARRGAEEAAARMRLQPLQDQQVIRNISPVFFEAAWELCRRGLVRPGPRRDGDQAVEAGGYSLTVAGRAALATLDVATVLLAQPGSLAAALSGYRRRYGDGFHQRALEAIKCRNAEAWLACCAMTGAAAESVLLALAIAKVGNEEQVLRSYKKTSGRRGVLNLIVAQANASKRDTLTTFSGIISMWRDEAAHGQASPLGAANADEGLRQLLHMCQWVDREWSSLTA